MRLIFSAEAWEDYSYWKANDRKTVDRIDDLIKDAMRHPFEGIGKPEPLRFQLKGWWSRRIDGTNRMVYRPNGGDLEIAQLRYHY